MPEGRLISTASITVAMPLHIAHLPDQGGAISARFTKFEVAGGFSVMSAARRQGVEVINASPVGTGPNSMLVRQALAAEGIRTVSAEVVGDTGICLVLLEKDGHNTSILSRGVEGEPQLDDLMALQINSSDWVYVAGTELAYAASSGLFLKWLDQIDEAVNIAFAPTQMVAEIMPDTLRRVLQRADLVTMNEREAQIIESRLGLESAGHQEVLQECLSPECVVVRRLGSRGCQIFRAGEQSVELGAYLSTTVDTTGVGDTHTGVLLASLIQGQDLISAATRANAAASITIGRPGAATAPTAVEIERIIG